MNLFELVLAKPKKTQKQITSLDVSERAAKIVEQQERERPPQKQASPRAGTPVGALMGVVPSPSTMGMINQTMTPVSGNPSQRQHECLTAGKMRLD